MAVYNEVQVGRYVRFLQKFLGIKGRQPAPLQFSGELGAIWPLFHGVENRFLESWERFGTSPQQAANATQNSAIQLRNPSTNNVACVVEKCALINGTTQVAMNLFLTGGNPADLSTIVTAVKRLDGRGRNTSPMIVSQQNNAATVAANQFGLVQTVLGSTIDVVLFEEQEITIMPGDALMIAAGNNATLTAFLIWRERPMEESELK